MLNYLVTSRARRALLQELWGNRCVGSVSALAKRAALSFSAAQRELAAMEQAGLAVSRASGNRVEYEANLASPHADLLESLLKTTAATEAPVPERDDLVRSWLKEHGAPLAVASVGGVTPAVEDVLVDALELAHRDSTVARALPVVLWRNRASLDWDAVWRAARSEREVQALGFFVEMTGRLGGERSLSRRAAAWRDRRRTKSHSFFSAPKGRFAKALEKRNTPAMAKRWGFLMNMPLDSFASMFEKFAT